MRRVAMEMQRSAVSAVLHRSVDCVGYLLLEILEKNKIGTWALKTNPEMLIEIFKYGARCNC